METLNRILHGLNNTSADGLALLECELDEELLQDEFKRLSPHEQVKLLHTVNQLFLKATKLFFTSSTEDHFERKIHDALYTYCLTWIRIISKSFAGTPLTIINMFLNDTFRFDKSIDIAFQETNSSSSQLFVHRPYSQISVPVSNSLSWCLWWTYQRPYVHLRAQTIQTILSIVQAKNFHVWIQQTLFKKPFRLEKDNKLVFVLSRLLKLSKLLLFQCGNDDEDAIKDCLNFMRILLETFADSPYFHHDPKSPLFQIALLNMQAMLHFGFESHQNAPSNSIKQNNNRATPVNSQVPRLSARATLCLNNLQHLLFSQKVNLLFLYVLHAQYECSGCDAFFVDISSVNLSSLGKKSADGKLLLMSVLLGMMKNKDEHISRVMNFLTRLLSEPLESMRVFAGEWIGYLWETMQTILLDNTIVMTNAIDGTDNVHGNLQNTSVGLQQINTSTSTTNAFAIFFKQQSLAYPYLSDANLVQLHHLLTQLLSDPASHLVRASAAAAIHHFPKGKFCLLDTNALIQALTQLTQDKTGKVRGAAQGALGDVSRAQHVPYNHESLLAVFMQGCQDSSLIVRLDAFWALSKYLSAKYIPAWFNNMSETTPAENPMASSTNSVKVAAFFQSDTARALLSLYQNAIVSDSDKVLPSLVLGYLSFSLMHSITATNDNQNPTLSSVQLLLSQFRHEIDTRLQRFLSLEMLLHPQIWDEATPEIAQVPEKLKQWKQLTNNKDITNIFALVFCLDVFVDVQDNLNIAINAGGQQDPVPVLSLNAHLWERVMSLLQSKRVYLQLQASQWLLGCLFASVPARSNENETTLCPEYPKELYLRLLEVVIALFFKTAHRMKTFHFQANETSTHNTVQHHSNNVSRSLTLKRLLLLMIARLIHFPLCRAASYSDLITQIVRFHLEKLISEMETMYLSSAVISWTNVFTFYPLFDGLGLLRGLKSDLGETLTDKSIVEYAAMVVQSACGWNNSNSFITSNSNNNHSSSIEMQNIAPSLVLRLRSLHQHSQPAAAPAKTVSYSSFDGLNVAQELSLLSPQTPGVKVSPEKSHYNQSSSTANAHDMGRNETPGTAEDDDDPDEI